MLNELECSMWKKNSDYIRNIKNVWVCKKANKKVYRTHTEAEKTIDWQWEHNKKKYYYYNCGGHYHLTSQQTFNGNVLKTSKTLEVSNGTYCW